MPLQPLLSDTSVASAMIERIRLVISISFIGIASVFGSLESETAQKYVATHDVQTQQRFFSATMCWTSSTTRFTPAPFAFAPCFMMLLSFRQPIRGTAVSAIFLMLAISPVNTDFNLAHADKTGDRDIPGSTDSSPTKDRPANEPLESDSSFVIKRFLPADDPPVTPGQHTDREEHSPDKSDRFWLINTRRLSSNASCLDLDQPGFAIYRLRDCSSPTQVSVDQFLQAIEQRGSAVIYVHGNRMSASNAIHRGLAVYRAVNRYRSGDALDWVIWSWPSDKQGMLMRDARIKAFRTDGQGLYLAWLLRRHAESGTNTTLIGYSFGGRIITGALHAAAGGKLGGRTLPGDPVVGGPFDAGLVAPAVDNHWLTDQGYHRFATQNLERLVLMYNRRDAVLKRYWLIDRVRGRMALGYSGPTRFSDRYDGEHLPVFARDCSPTVGLRHDELDYYQKDCRAGSQMARLIDDFFSDQ